MRSALKSGVFLAISAVLLSGSAYTVAQASGTPEAQPPLVEDYAYPGAAAIQTSTGISLISGDGHITFADCATPADGDIGLVRVRTSQPDNVGKNGLVCFKVHAAPGLLTLKVPAVYEIRGDGRIDGTGHKVQAELTTDQGQHTTVQVDPSGSTQVGVGANPAGRPTTLLQLTAKP